MEISYTIDNTSITSSGSPLVHVIVVRVLVNYPRTEEFTEVEKEAYGKGRLVETRNLQLGDKLLSNIGSCRDSGF